VHGRRNQLEKNEKPQAMSECRSPDDPATACRKYREDRRHDRVAQADVQESVHDRLLSTAFALGPIGLLEVVDQIAQFLEFLRREFLGPNQVGEERRQRALAQLVRYRA